MTFSAHVNFFLRLHFVRQHIFCYFKFSHPPVVQYSHFRHSFHSLANWSRGYCMCYTIEPLPFEPFSELGPCLTLAESKHISRCMEFKCNVSTETDFFLLSKDSVHLPLSHREIRGSDTFQKVYFILESIAPPTTSGSEAWVLFLGTYRGGSSRSKLLP